MASSQTLQEQENKVLQKSTQTLKTVNIKESQVKGPCLKRGKEIIENNILLHHPDKAKEHLTVKRLLRERRKLKVNNSNILVRKTTDAEQIIIPSSLKCLIFQEFHKNMAHLGRERTYKLAKERVY